MDKIRKVVHFNSSRFRIDIENLAFAKQIPEGSVVLDAGAGIAPYRHLFQHTQYETADFEQVEKSYAPSTYICDLVAIPVEDSRFDYIIFNQVMEHLPEPKTVLFELHRVLKPNGKVIYTGPLFYEEHEQPYDFYRYTRYGLNHLFKESNFKVDRMDWLEGYFGTLGYQFKCMFYYLPLNRKDLGGGILGLLLIPLIWMLRYASLFLSVLFHQLEKRNKFTKKGYPKNYIAILTKN